DNVVLEVENALQVTQRHVQYLPDAGGQTLQEPHVGDGARQLDVSHALAADFGLDDLDATLFADDTTVLHALVFTAGALPVFDGAEDFLAEQTAHLGLERPVVDGLRLPHFTIGPGPNFLRGGQ